MSRHTEIQVERRLAAGLPVLSCPNCGKQEAHWVPDSLDDYELVVPGFFTCERAKERPDRETQLQGLLKITAMDREGRFIWMRAAHLERATSSVSVSVLEGNGRK